MPPTERSDHHRVSGNIIEASWQALADSIVYGLIHGARTPTSRTGPWPRHSSSRPRRSTSPARTSRPTRPRGVEGRPSGELTSRQPVGPQLGYQGPDRGGLLLAERFRDRLQSQPAEAPTMQIQGCLGVALRRASIFGRAPAVHDFTVAFTIWGFLGASPPSELVAMHKPMFEGVRTSCTTTPSAGHRQSRPRGDAAPSARRGGDGVPGLLAGAARALGAAEPCWRQRWRHGRRRRHRWGHRRRVRPANWPPPAARSCCSSRRSSWRTTRSRSAAVFLERLRPAHRARRSRRPAGPTTTAPERFGTPLLLEPRRTLGGAGASGGPARRSGGRGTDPRTRVRSRRARPLPCAVGGVRRPRRPRARRRGDRRARTAPGLRMRGLVEAGGSVVRSACVRTLEPAGSGWRLGWAGGGLSAAAVVLAAGAWCDELAALAGARPLRAPTAPSHDRGVRVPAGSSLDPEGPLVSDAAHSWYFKPEVRTCSYRRPTRRPVSRATPGPTRPSPSASKRVNEATTLGLRSVVSTWAGLRTFAPDGVPVVGEDRTAPACSGWQAKAATASRRRRRWPAAWPGWSGRWDPTRRPLTA